MGKWMVKYGHLISGEVIVRYVWSPSEKALRKLGDYNLVPDAEILSAERIYATRRHGLQ